MANSGGPEPRARSQLVAIKPSRLSLSLGRSSLTNGQLEVILAVELCRTSQEPGRRNEREGDVLWPAPSKHHRIIVLLTASLSICYSVPLAQQQVTLILEVWWSCSDWRFCISFILLNSSMLVFDIFIERFSSKCVFLVIPSGWKCCLCVDWGKKVQFFFLVCWRGKEPTSFDELL